MKLVRFGALGKEKPGLIDAEGRLRDLSGVIPDITADVLSPAGLARLAKLAPARLPRVRGAKRLGVPVAHVPKCIAIGLNYADHAAEANLPVPAEPILFMKATSALAGAYDPLMLPRGSRKTDWEVELGVVIGSVARSVSERRALDYVAGYCVVNDISERAYQFERGGQWDKGKGCDGFAPVGPWLVTRDEVPAPQTLGLWLDVNGTRMQSGNTRTMVFNVRQLIAYVSRFMTLMPGDILATGTPPGVGMGHSPQRFLRPGDRMRLGIDGLGEQEQRVVAFGTREKSRTRPK